MPCNELLRDQLKLSNIGSCNVENRDTVDFRRLPVNKNTSTNKPRIPELDSGSSVFYVTHAGIHSAHPCASPCGQHSCAKVLSCTFVNPLSCVQHPSPPIKKPHHLTVAGFIYMVEARGIEPLSANPPL